ncbi:AMP-binding protein [Acinetobacter radioresistens]|uniref:AMP-binding protein n=1 Tax=Acinetobacter radioresistens TaxID=40216 RepID=UPI000DACD384|nr:AMP-binding protein [Acinetobacter radioresistens]AWV87711.1 long-chain fatty acid--CoA ligase [Acinetobacter radioresistens]MCX0327951.1 AMP-binding protein [Acinetobacter radioresistens]RJL75109.1 long-chain fatty acid--CoA ligase [Acinetobacter radioresistens]
MTENVWSNEYKQWNIAPTIQLPARHVTLLDFWENSFQKFSSRTAFIFKDKKFSFDEIEQYSRKFASFLQHLQLPQGSRIAVMMPNIIQYPIASLAVIRAGYILVNVNPLYTARELQHQLHDAGASVLVLLDQFMPVYQQVKDQLAIQHVVITAAPDLLVDPAEKPESQQEAQIFSLKDILSETLPETYLRPKLDQEDTVVLQYTGGTTGVSKGAELTHRNIIANLLQNNAVFCSYFGDRDAYADEVTICALPLYHIFAFTVCLLHSTLNKGYATVLVANPRDLSDLVHCFKTYQPAVFPAVNTLFNALINHQKFKTLDHSHLCITTGGGMTVFKSTADAWQRITGCMIREGYGLSETSPVATFNPPASTTFSGSIGIPLPATEIKILDDTGQEVVQGEKGEIAIRGPQVMKGYWNLPEETAKVMTVDGFFRSGDIGVMDVKGYVRIIDRKKDMILVSGFNVFPNEIEAVLSQHPKVQEVAVIGVADEKSGEVPKAFIVKKEQSLTAEEIQSYARENLTGYKQPRYIEFLHELPKSTVGKILRKALRQDTSLQ